MPGRAPGWQRLSQHPAVPHGAGLSPSASLAQTTTEKPGLSVKRTHFGICNQLGCELTLNPPAIRGYFAEGND